MSSYLLLNLQLSSRQQNGSKINRKLTKQVNTCVVTSIQYSLAPLGLFQMNEANRGGVQQRIPRRWCATRRAGSPNPAKPTGTSACTAQHRQVLPPDAGRPHQRHPVRAHARTGVRPVGFGWWCNPVVACLRTTRVLSDSECLDLQAKDNAFLHLCIASPLWRGHTDLLSWHFSEICPIHSLIRCCNLLWLGSLVLLAPYVSWWNKCQKGTVASLVH
jgi:hypothetical protein